MSIILGVVAAVILIGIGLLRSRHPQKEATPVFVRRFIHPGHTWVRETEDGDVLVGIDDFATSVLGRVDAVRLPRLLKSLKQGGAAFELSHGNRVLPFVSPVNGRVIEKNEMVLNNPSVIGTAPYGDGWLVRIRPRRLPSQLANLLTGRAAQQWQDGMRARLHQFFSATPALMYQDGGEFVRDLPEKCSDEEWNALVAEFFHATR